MQPPNKRPILHCDHPPNRLEQVAQFSTVTMAQFSTVTDTTRGLWQVGVDLSGDVTLETAEDLAFAKAFSGTSFAADSSPVTSVRVSSSIWPPASRRRTDSQETASWRATSLTAAVCFRVFLSVLTHDPRPPGAQPAMDLLRQAAIPPNSSSGGSNLGCEGFWLPRRIP
jgi:hypothetical protein